MITIIHHRSWFTPATEGLRDVLRDDFTVLKQQVNSGMAQLWEITTHQGLSWMITRVEKINDQKELVVCCYQGCDVKTVTDVVYHCAVKQGFSSIRFHTHRTGLNRLVKHLGFEYVETMYRKVLTEATV